MAKYKYYDQNQGEFIVVNDPLLDYRVTEKKAKNMFKKIIVHKFDFPYHQPPEPFTFEGLNRDYKDLLNKISRYLLVPN